MKNNEFVFDTMAVAKKYGLKHTDVRGVAEKVLYDLLSVNSLYHDAKIKREDRAYRNRKFFVYLMNEEALSLVVWRLKGEKVFEWQVIRNSTYYAMEKALKGSAEFNIHPYR